MQLPHIRNSFAARFGAAPEVIARAPGRVNLIGEHTDYNEGFVLPIALEQSTWAALRARTDRVIRVYAAQLDEEQSWETGAWEKSRPHWTSYIAGIADLLAQRGARLPGFDLLIDSDVPVGGGLSSSAALEVSTAKSLAQLAGEPLDSRDMADLCRTAEHEYAGVPVGIMDQYVSLLAQAGTAFLLDCRSRTWKYVPLELASREVVVINSGVKHELANGEYAKRQRECAEAVKYFQKLNPKVRALRDVDVETARAHASQMEPVAAARALHVTSENRRTLQFADALRARDWKRIGELMAESHRSLRDDYEVSSPELDQIVELAQALPGVIGARMTGGGFGGCVITIAEAGVAPALKAALSEKYDGPKRRSTVFETRPGAGASIELG